MSRAHDGSVRWRGPDEGGGDGDCEPIARVLVTEFEHDSTCSIEAQQFPRQLWPEIIDGWVDILMPVKLRSHGRSDAVVPTSIAVDALGGDLDIEFNGKFNMCVRKTSGNAAQVGLRCVATYPAAGPPIDLIIAPQPLGEWCAAMGGALVEEFWTPSCAITIPRFSDITAAAGFPADATGAPTVKWQAFRHGPNNNDIEIQGANFEVVQALPVYVQTGINNCEDGVFDCPEVIEFDVYDNAIPAAPVLLGTVPSGAGPFFLPVNFTGPIRVDIKLTESVDPLDWTETIIGGSAPESITYSEPAGVPTYQVEYVHPFPAAAPTLVSWTSVDDTLTCPSLGEALTISVFA